MSLQSGRCYQFQIVSYAVIRIYKSTVTHELVKADLSIGHSLVLFFYHSKFSEQVIYVLLGLSVFPWVVSLQLTRLPFFPLVLFFNASPKINPVLSTEIDTVTEQDDKLVSNVRYASKPQLGYSQTHHEALAVHQTVQRLHKCLSAMQFQSVFDHETVKFIFSPARSMSRVSPALVLRWGIAFSGLKSTVAHKLAKHIPYAEA